MNTHVVSAVALERIIMSVEIVRERLLRATRALEAASVPYAVIGGNAVAALVGEIDLTAVRYTQDVDILLRRADLESAKEAMSAAGFVYRHAASIDMFLDGPTAKARDAVHVIFAGEKVRQEYALPAPDVDQSSMTESYRVLGLEALVTMKLTSYRRKDQVHILDFIHVGLLDQSWTERLPPELAARLQELLDDPDG